MIALYVDGEKVGTLAEAEQLIPALIAQNRRVEFRGAAGNSVGTLTPTPPLAAGEPLVAWERISLEPGSTFEMVHGIASKAITSAEDDPDWVKAITPEETARRLAGPFLTLDEYRKQAGQ